MCRAQSVLCKQRDNLNRADCSGEGRTFSLPPPTAGRTRRDRDGCAGHKVAQTEGAVVAVYNPKSLPPPPSRVTPPQVRWSSAASSLFPKEFHFPKVESHSPLLQFLKSPHCRVRGQKKEWVVGKIKKEPLCDKGMMTVQFQNLLSKNRPS